MIIARLIDGLIPLAGGIYGLLLGCGVIRMHKDPEKAATNLRRYGTPLKILCPLVVIWGLYLIITSF
jgi:hypothetical protein